MPRLPDAVDRALDATVVLSFTNLGYRARRDGFEPLPRLDGKTVVVTGSTSGLGAACARRLARLGARVWVVGRDGGRVGAAGLEIMEHVPDADVLVGRADLGRLDDVRRLADEILERDDEIHALVSNAGSLDHRRIETPDGNEQTLAVHVLGPFLLAHSLRPALARADEGRIVVVSSGGMYATRLDVRDVQSRRGRFNGTITYARAKRAQVVLTEMAAEVLADDGIAVSSMHPGWADTPGVQESLPRFNRIVGSLQRDADEGADTMAWLAAAPDPMSRTGRFFLDRKARPTHKVPWTRESDAERRRLWREVVRLTGVEC